MSKQCVFCKEEAEYCPLEEMSNYGIDVYFCRLCQTEYVIYNDTYTDMSNDYSIYIQINDRMFRWSSHNANKPDHHYVNLYLVGVPGIPGVKPNRELKLIKTFRNDFIPDITPLNIKEKIQVYLPFI